LQVSHGIYWSCCLFELLLLAKAVVVAVLGKERLLPPKPEGHAAARGDVGLLCMYASLVAALLSSFLEGWLAQRLVVRWRKQLEMGQEARGGGSAAQPLLGKKQQKAEVRRACACMRVVAVLGMDAAGAQVPIFCVPCTTCCATLCS
jgi:hypothetical protein